MLFGLLCFCYVVFFFWFVDELELIDLFCPFEEEDFLGIFLINRVTYAIEETLEKPFERIETSIDVLSVKMFL